MLYKILISITLICNAMLADDISEGTHAVSKEVYITNSNEYPNIALIACIDAISGGSGCYKVVDNEAIYAGYKFNKLRVFTIKKELLDAQESLASGYHNVNANAISDKLFQISKDIDAPLFHYSTIMYVEDSLYAKMTEDKYYHELFTDDTNTTHLRVKKRVVGFSDKENKIINY